MEVNIGCNMQLTFVLMTPVVLFLMFLSCCDIILKSPHFMIDSVVRLIIFVMSLIWEQMCIFDARVNKHIV